MHEYGKSSWESLWEKLEQAGNIGLDYVINPSLYSHIINFITKNPKSIVVDFGSGTNLMGIQLLFGYKDSVPALKDNADVDHARFNTLLYIGVEGSKELVEQSNRYLNDIGNPKNISSIQAHIDEKINLFDDKSVDLCVSRNFLMHLSMESFLSHIKYVSEILKPGGYYIFTTLNPNYELRKVNRDLVNGEKYDFLHGKEGEYGTFYHYYKTSNYIKEIIEKYFDIENFDYCIPITDKFKKTHSRYYENEPMACTYVLKVKS